MTKSDKRLTEDLFLPFQLLVLALESIKGQRGEELAKLIKNEVVAHFDQHGASDKIIKLIKRCEKLSCQVMLPVADKNKVSGHKMVLLLHHLAELMIASGHNLPQFIETIFAPFLEIEAIQDNISDKEWSTLKKSAEKQAKKVLEKLQELSYFNN